MRYWVIATCIVLLVLCVPDLFMSVRAADWLRASVCLLLLGLGAHGLHYARVAKTDPARGYPQTAAGQLLLGILCAGLLVRLGYLMDTPAQWEKIGEQVQALVKLIPALANASPQELEQAVQQTLEPMMHLMLMFCYAMAALVLVSQIVFAALLYRRRKTIPTKPQAQDAGQMQ